ncbi:MAG: hypothetical protein ACQERT_06990 [Thermodesulfobacteriota bacterium]
MQDARRAVQDHSSRMRMTWKEIITRQAMKVISLGVRPGTRGRIIIRPSYVLVSFITD